jgi:RNA polymerase sigma-70 factor (sigma-E family)
MDPTPQPAACIRPCHVSNVEFADFVRANSSILLHKAHLMTGSGLAAEELVQDTLVRLYPRWGKVTNADVPLAYVQRSLTNNFISQRRRGSDREIATNVVPDQVGACSTERDVVDRDEVSALLKTLGPRQRTVLVLRFYEGLNDVEIADYLGCRVGTVRSLASRGLATLRQRVAARRVVSMPIREHRQERAHASL